MEPKEIINDTMIEMVEITDKAAVEVRFFASLKDHFSEALELNLLEVVDTVLQERTSHDQINRVAVADLVKFLQSHHGGAAEILGRSKVAVNNSFANAGEPIMAGDVVDFLPPFSGG